MQPVGNHEFNAGSGARLDHRVTVLFLIRQRLLAQHMNARAGGPLGILPMQMVGQGQVHRIDFPAAQALVVLVVVVGVSDAIPHCERPALLRVVRDESCQRGVAPRVGEAGEHRGLGDPSQTNDRVTDPSVFSPPWRRVGALVVVHESLLPIMRQR